MDLAKTIFNKDSTDNNCLHYSYMIDLPEVRQILRNNNLLQERSQRLNRRGQLPTKLRHYTKAEDSNEETEDEDKYEAQEKEVERFDQEVDALGGGLGLAITGSALKATSLPVKKSPKAQASIEIEELIAGTEDFDLADPADNYRLKFNRELTKKQKLAHYQTPDYCIVTRADTLQVLRLELDSLVRKGGVYYSIFDKIDEPEDFNKTRSGGDLMMIVLYFDDSVVDLMGEILGIECRISKADVAQPFKCYAADYFDQFNAR